MKKYAFPLLGMLAVCTLTFAQGFVLQSAGELESISKEQVVLRYQNADHAFSLNEKTKLIDGNGRPILVADFKKGENVTVTSDVNSKVATQVKKGLITIRIGF